MNSKENKLHLIFKEVERIMSKFRGTLSHRAFMLSELEIDAENKEERVKAKDFLTTENNDKTNVLNIH